MQNLEIQQASIHGHELAFRTAGSGPVMLLVHGMAGSSSTWLDVMPALVDAFHGRGARDVGPWGFGQAPWRLLVGCSRGHSSRSARGVGTRQYDVGGPVPWWRCRYAVRLPVPRALRTTRAGSSGGLGQEVNVLLRGLSLPGAEFLLAMGCNRWVYAAGTTVVRSLRRLGARPSPEFADMWDSYGSLADGETRAVFLQTLRSVVDHAGQRVSATDRLYLTDDVPTLIVWGDHDPILPVRHAYTTHAAIPRSRLEIFEGIGHYPNVRTPIGSPRCSSTSCPRPSPPPSRRHSGRSFWSETPRCGPLPEDRGHAASRRCVLGHHHGPAQDDRGSMASSSTAQDHVDQ